MLSTPRLLLQTRRLMAFKSNHTIPKDRLRGKVAIVTASTKGIGLAIAKRLAQEGAKVIISSRKQENVDKAIKTLAAQNLNVTGLVCHVSKAEDRNKLFKEASKLGGVDILVSNAAINPDPSPMLESNEKVWDKIFDVNVKAPFLLSQEAAKDFRIKGGGHIVYISSFIAYQAPIVCGTGIYSISKTALLGLTKALAVETARDNINVNCVCPGIIYSDFGNHIIDNDEYAKVNLENIPMRKFGEPDDICGAVAFLVSDDSKYITGESIVIAGGGPSRL